MKYNNKKYVFSIVMLFQLFLFPSLLQAQDYNNSPPPIKTVMPYASYILFGDDTNKDISFISGLYLSYFDYTSKYEFGFENNNITYKSAKSDLIQNDFTFKYSFFWSQSNILKSGVHYINSGDELTDKTISYTLGFTRYKYLKYNFGLDAYYTNFNNYLTPFKIVQTSPFVGFYFWESIGKTSKFYLNGKYNIAYIKGNSYIADKGVNSFLLSLSYFNVKFGTSVGITTGEDTFAIQNDGFTVFNNANVYKLSGSISFSYYMSFSQSFLLKLKYATFEDEITFMDSNYQGIFFSYTYSF